MANTKTWQEALQATSEDSVVNDESTALVGTHDGATYTVIAHDGVVADEVDAATVNLVLSEHCVAATGWH